MRVAVVQLVLPNYKLPLFEKLGKAKGVDLTLFVGTKGGKMHPTTEGLGEIKHVMLDNHLLRIVFEFIWQGGIRKIALNQFDVLIIPEGVLFLSNYWLMWQAHRHGIPVGIYSHGFNYQRRKSLLSGLLEGVRRRIHQRADFIIVYSEEGRTHIVEQNEISGSRVFVSPNTLDVEGIVGRVGALVAKDYRSIRVKYGLPLQEILIVFPGRLVEEKKPIWLIYAVEELRSRGFAVTAVFIGKGPEEQALRLISDDSRKAEPVAIFLGALPARDVDFILAASDIVAVPGMTGLAVVHAFACGKPYVTTHVSTHGPEMAYLEDGETGLVVEHSRICFTDALESLVRDPTLREALGRNAQNYALQELSMERQVKGFEDALTYAVNNNRVN